MKWFGISGQQNATCAASASGYVRRVPALYWNMKWVKLILFNTTTTNNTTPTPSTSTTSTIRTTTPTTNNSNNNRLQVYILKLEKLNRLEISGRSAQTGVNWCIGSTLLS